jgi:GINS complex protein
MTKRRVSPKNQSTNDSGRISFCYNKKNQQQQHPLSNIITMSASGRQKNNMELASFRSAFLADDTVVTIVPDFAYPNKIPLLSGSTQVGPFHSGIPTKAPLWFAMMLQQRSLCTLQVPNWLDTEHLTQVKQHETTEKSLTPTSQEVHGSGSKATQDDSVSLPFYYAELGQRFTTTSNAASQAPQASNLVLQDIAMIRLDKVRQQFQQLSKQQKDNPNLCVSVPGIASAELTQLKPLILQALNDQRFLVTSGGHPKKNEARKKATPEDEEEEEENRPNPSLRSSRLRRFRG